MTHYLIESEDCIFVKICGVLSFSNNMHKNIGKTISKEFSGTFIQNPVDHTNKTAADALKTFSKKVIRETAEETNDLNCSKIADKITNNFYLLIPDQKKNS